MIVLTDITLTIIKVTITAVLKKNLPKTMPILTLMMAIRTIRDL